MLASPKPNPTVMHAFSETCIFPLSLSCFVILLSFKCQFYYFQRVPWLGEASGLTKPLTASRTDCWEERRGEKEKAREGDCEKNQAGKARLLPVKIFSCWSVHCCSFVLESEFQTFGEIKKSQTVQAILSCRYGGFNMLLCTIVENGANTRFCRESGECRDYALFLSFFCSEKSNFGRNSA